MSTFNNKRVWYAVQEVGVAVNGSNTFTAIHGLQSIGINTKFNLEHVFEIGQSEAYETIDNVPDIEITLEKDLDGNPLLWHLLTKGATSGSLIGRSNIKTAVGFSIFNDTFESASGTPLSQCTMSGMFVSNLEYTIPVNGAVTESVTAMGNSKVWNNAYTITTFNNADVPTAVSGIQRRWHVMLGSGNSLFPSGIPGINGTDHYLYADSDGNFPASLQQVKISANLGRESMFELGHKGPYHRYVSFPVEVRTDIEIMAKDQGDYITGNLELTNVSAQPIKVKLNCGTIFDLGTKNYLSSVSYGGANAGQNGGNGTCTYSYMNNNRLLVSDPADPSGL